MILDINESDISCKDLLTDDFSILTKTEHNYKLFDIKKSLEMALCEIISDTDCLSDDKRFIIAQMKCRIEKWII